MSGLVKVARGRWLTDPSTGEMIAPGSVLSTDHPAAKANPQLCFAIRGAASEIAGADDGGVEVPPMVVAVDVEADDEAADEETLMPGDDSDGDEGDASF